MLMLTATALSTNIWLNFPWQENDIKGALALDPLTVKQLPQESTICIYPAIDIQPRISTFKHQTIESIIVHTWVI